MFWVSEDRTFSGTKSRRYETLKQYTRFIRLAQEIFKVRDSSYRVPDSSYLSACTLRVYSRTLSRI